MANEIQFSYVAGATTYVLLRNTIGQIWSTVANAFQAYSTANYLNYVIAATQQGTASAFYAASVPTGVPPGSYNIVAKNEIGGTQAETDPTIAAGTLEWNGAAVAPISNIAVSGTILPIQLQRGTQVLNYPLYLRSSADHITPFTSGIVSGQISKDGGIFGPLINGVFTEVGYGVYSLQALTSGDTNCNTMSLLFTANGVLGGSSDPLVQSFVMQHASGY